MYRRDCVRKLNLNRVSKISCKALEENQNWFHEVVKSH